MARHMLLQFPLLLVAGAALASSLPPRLCARIEPFNAHGLAGLLIFLVVSGFWMIPRALDQALLSPQMELAKFATLLTAGGALQLSWRVAGTIVQTFFTGNWVWMTAVAGLLYQDVSARLCNAYLLDEQVVAGRGLVVLAAVMPTVLVGLLMMRGGLAANPDAPMIAD